jgi:hypothetical protein
MKRTLFCTLFAVAACAPEAPAPVAARKVLAPAPVSVPHLAEAAKVQAPPQATEEKPDANKELARRVHRALESEHRIHAAAIDVTAKGGVVTLWGTAASPDERQRASRVAYRVNGVTAVQNNLAIASGS